MPLAFYAGQRPMGPSSVAARGPHRGLVNGWNTLASEFSDANFLGRARIKTDANTFATTFAVVTGNFMMRPAFRWDFAGGP